MSDETANAKFPIGALVQHNLFDYRGVIVDVDQEFQGTDEWYQKMARSKPPKDQPWYHVLVHGSDQQTYVAQRNLSQDKNTTPIEHPLLGAYFREFKDGSYVARHRSH